MEAAEKETDKSILWKHYQLRPFLRLIYPKAMNTENHYLTRLKDVIFIDGKILSFDNTEDVLKVRFRDYANSDLEIAFYGVSSIQTSEDMYFEAADYKLTDNAEDKFLTLLDDENKSMFSVKSKESSVNIL